MQKTAEAAASFFLCDKAGERAPRMRERTFDGQRTSKRLCREMCSFLGIKCRSPPELKFA